MVETSTRSTSKTKEKKSQRIQCDYSTTRSEKEETYIEKIKIVERLKQEKNVAKNLFLKNMRALKKS